jgi:hypothetical protein
MCARILVGIPHRNIFVVTAIAYTSTMSVDAWQMLNIASVCLTVAAVAVPKWVSLRNKRHEFQ